MVGRRDGEMFGLRPSLGVRASLPWPPFRGLSAGRAIAIHCSRLPPTHHTVCHIYCYCHLRACLTNCLLFSFFLLTTYYDNMVTW